MCAQCDNLTSLVSGQGGIINSFYPVVQFESNGGFKSNGSSPPTRPLKASPYPLRCNRVGQ